MERCAKQYQPSGGTAEGKAHRQELLPALNTPPTGVKAVKRASILPGAARAKTHLRGVSKRKEGTRIFNRYCPSVLENTAEGATAE
jgi:hypothetical protein